MNRRRSIFVTVILFVVGIIGLGIVAFGAYVALLVDLVADVFDGRADYTLAWQIIAVGLLVLSTLAITELPRLRRRLSSR